MIAKFVARVETFIIRRETGITRSASKGKEKDFLSSPEQITENWETMGFAEKPDLIMFFLKGYAQIS